MQNLMRRETTKWWELYVRYKDGSSYYVTLKDLKNSYPVETADYAVANRIDQEPEFSWWIPHVIKKRKAVLNNAGSKYWQHIHKKGIYIPKTVQEALDEDRNNGYTLWVDSIQKEIPKIVGAVAEHDDDISDLVGYQ